MLALFLTEAAAGSLLVLMLVPPKEAGRKFFRFGAAQSCLLILLGLALSHPGGGMQGARTWLLGLSALALMAASGLFHLGRAGTGLGLLAGGLAAALAGVALDALAAIPPGDATGLSRLLYPLDALGAGLLTGSALIAMLLGHYYLNIPGLSIRHLQRLCFVFMAAVGLRAALLGIAIARSREALAPLAGLLLDTQGREWPVSGPDPYVLVFLLLHVTFGILAPAVMSVMAWRTALIASTQSATGILYVALLMVIMGELASRYLLTLTGWPL